MVHNNLNFFCEKGKRKFKEKKKKHWGGKIATIIIVARKRKRTKKAIGKSHKET